MVPGSLHLDSSLDLERFSSNQPSIPIHSGAVHRGHAGETRLSRGRCWAPDLEPSGDSLATVSAKSLVGWGSPIFVNC